MLVITIALLAVSVGSVPVPSFPVELPAPDGLLHVYNLPVGQGDAQVVQCPSGHLGLVDFGSNQWPKREPEDERFWGPGEILAFLGDQSSMIHSITVTHNHWDHYSLLPDTFTTSSSLPGLQHIYITCTPGDMASALGDWVRSASLEDQVKWFNGGNTCGPRGGDCDPIDLCPHDPGVTTKVLSVNLGGHCTDGGNKNIDSIVFKVMMDDVSIMLNGDFEDETPDWGEDGPQKEMVDFYGDELRVTVYKLAHHGASYLANKPIFRDAVAPRAVFVSANTDYSYRHPRCSVFDGFIEYVTPPLCQPQETDPESVYYCGEHVWPDLGADDVTQVHYTCGTASADPPVSRDGNTYALYTTTPSPDTLNVVHFATDGQRWGFRNNFIDT